MQTFNFSQYLTKQSQDDKDAQYLKAVEDGDMEIAQQMVNDAAISAGFEPKTLYRGDRPGKKRFTGGKEDASIVMQGSIFLFDDPMLASFYTSQRTNYRRNPSKMTSDDGLYRLYAKLGGNVFIYDAKDSDWIDIKAPDEIGGEHNYPFGIQIDDLAAEIKKMGYSAMVVHNVGDQSGWGSQYIVFDPSQVKTADAVTYDDEHQIIPLSKRFDSSKDDIRL